jgi:Holliday junction resolvase RusA-like endonuclease
MEQRFLIPFRLPGLNDIIRAKRGISKRSGHDGYSLMKKEIQKKIGFMLNIARIKPVVDKRVSFRFLWIEPDRRRDKDNVVAGRKFIFDALVAHGILPDDRWKQISGWSDDFAVDKENAGVQVTMLSS